MRVKREMIKSTRSAKDLGDDPLPLLLVHLYSNDLATSILYKQFLLHSSCSLLATTDKELVYNQNQ